MKILFSFVYRLLYLLNKKIFFRKKYVLSHAKLVVVGSYLVGGAGKTPFTKALAEFLNQKKKRIAILVHQKANDEYRMLKKMLPFCSVFKTKNRAEKSLELDAHFDFILCDDGFEDFRLDAASVLLLDWGIRASKITDLIPNGKCRSLKQDHKEITDVLKCFGKNKDVDFYISEIMPPLPKNSKVAVLCGIGNPERFCADLKALSFEIQKTCFCKDHEKHIEKYLSELSEWNLPIILTEKDAVKLASKDFEMYKIFTAKQDVKFHTDFLESFYKKITSEV